ncbi:hypothetical protein TSUD_28600 [Trifolium subterraneum]|uniref:Reverse transcriptase zinc-binding domain-containing protein n=1 Tax=Trifolium subterraneum TaxID=3900 RepID=A0A2Z6PFK3_TRISU|nr:hypothetical protein TSUD_28600 [Trifolium subterraneum]
MMMILSYYDANNILVGINVDDNWLIDAYLVVNCKVGQIPFIYLGLPIGGNPRRHSLWIPLLEKIRKRLSGWKSHSLSMGGHLVLLKSVLSSLLVYFLSFFKAPAGKWSWRLLVDKGGLWFKVLVAKYGMTYGRITRGGRLASLWWQDLCDVRDGIDLSIGRWFENNISRKVGNGRGWDAGGNGWRWGRHLFAWEEDLVLECCAVLENLFLQVVVMDKWMWRPDPSIGYSVRSAYHLLTHLVPVAMATHNDVIWNKVVPLNVSLFAWRLLNNRLPLKDNLTRRGMHLEDSELCLGGCGVAETIDHLIVGCDMSSSLWIKILNWLGIFGPLPNVVTDHVSK